MAPGDVVAPVLALKVKRFTCSYSRVGIFGHHIVCLRGKLIWR